MMGQRSHDQLIDRILGDVSAQHFEEEVCPGLSRVSVRFLMLLIEETF
jgi:hypothetical protein